MKLKIIAYNILTGLCDWSFYSKEIPILNKNRIELAKKIIKIENPDILCLTEGLFGMKNYTGVYIDYQKMFNYPYIDIRFSNIILSKYPIVYSEEIKKNGGSGLISQIKIKNKTISLNIIHHRPSVSVSEKKRLEFVKALFEKVNNPSIILGDLNSLSSSDNYIKNFQYNFKNKVLMSSHKVNKKTTNKIMKDMLTGKVVKYIESKSLVDTFKIKNKAFDFTIPTDYTSKDKSTGIRIDYIFTHPKIRVLDAGIIKNKLTEQASDHYPIYAILDV